MSVHPGARRNRLAAETSPYLLQHASNPVDWYPWGPEALDRARQTDRPILLSVGYAACHWCHVMERESFENEAIAALMNDHFVCIKVDREERPDLDDVYMAATVALSGGGGWPMTVFLTPDREPFFAGTYFPPTDRWGRPGFATLLRRVAEMWRSDRAALVEQAQRLLAHVRTQAEPDAALAVSDDALGDAARQLERSFDAEWGGFGGAPKFPPSAQLSLLLRHHQRSGSDVALRMVRRTLDCMAGGGIYDHLGGGFARYSTDERWLVPHFEKMLYDNAQLASVYFEAFQVTGEADYARVARETLDYVAREMQSSEGGYFSATDADSEGEEGKYFVWHFDELDEFLERAEAEAFRLYYGVTASGNWEGKSILEARRSRDDVARELGTPRQTFDALLDSARTKALAARSKRVPPLCDDKILTSWNGSMIAAMADGARVLGDPRYLDSARRAADDLMSRLARPDGGLYRTARAGAAHLDAYLDDYAYLSDALITLYEAGAPRRYLDHAVRLVERMIEDFADEAGGAFFQTAHQHESLVVRMREGHDGAVPNPNAVAARALARLAAHFDRGDWRELATAAIFAYGRAIERMPRGFCTSLGVVDFLGRGPVELAIVGAPGDPKRTELARELARAYLPNRIVAHLDPAAPEEALGLPLLAGKSQIDGTAAVFVCRNFTCRAPAVDSASLREALREATGGKSTEFVPKLSGRATAAGTEAYAALFRDALGERAFAPLGRTGLRVSRLGFGGYRVSDENSEHRAALERAFSRGVNLVDTSNNYVDGHSERLVGSVLSALVGRGELRREEVVIVSKIGYVQGKNRERAEERARQNRPFADMVEVSDGVWHCIHPEWLEAELDRSLARLGLETLDVCLLHNPEYSLSAARARGETLEAARARFVERLELAFAYLETEVRRGRIGAYGVSSNTLASAVSSFDATDPELVLSAARKAGGDEHHFSVVELPLNLFEPGAALAGGGASVLEWARARSLAVLANRPLNAIVGDALLRLADPPSVEASADPAAELSAVSELEREFREALYPALAKRIDTAPQSLFDWGNRLAPLVDRLASFEQYREIEQRIIAPHVADMLAALDGAFEGDDAERWTEFRGRYVAALDALTRSLARLGTERSARLLEPARRALAPLVPPELVDAPFSQQAIAAVLAAPGVTSVLVGMRAVRYVDDALATLPRLGSADSVPWFEAVTRTRSAG